MLKIHQIFIVKFLILFVGTILISSIISYVSLKSIIIQHNQHHLQDVISILSIDIDSENNLDDLVKNIHETTDLRLTIINTDGVVIAESNADKTTMDNHSQRYEIIKAASADYGHIVRYSNTTNVDYLYVAKKIVYKKDEVYLRVATSLAAIMDNFYDLWSKLTVVLVIIVFGVLYIARGMSKRVVYDIDQITSYLSEISNKNYKAIIKTKYFQEFLQISLLLKDLVKKLDKRDRQKRKYTAKLRLVNKQRNDILSAISHEFKNPIASIIGYTQTIRDDADMPLKIREKFLAKIESNGDKISKMLDRLALSVKLENGDLNLHPSEFDLSTLCNEVATNLNSKYKDREILVDVKSSRVVADKTMLELVIINLVDNALKYSKSDVKIFLDGDIISVQDTGIGIKEEHLEKVTSKFYRVDKNSWDNSMGIGLAMVSYILKALSTSLEIKSTFGEGSTFSFDIKEMSA